MDAALAIPGIQIGMIAAPCSPSIGKHEDALVAVHECLRFKDIRARRTRLQLLITVQPHHRPPRTSGDLRHRINTKALDYRIKRCCHRGKSAQSFDHRVTGSNGGTTQDGIAIGIAHWLGTRIAIFIDKNLHQPDREALHQIIDDILAGGEIDFEMFTLYRAQIGKPSVEHGFSGRDELDHRRLPVRQHLIDCGQQAWQLHRKEELREEALFSSLEDRKCCSLCALVKRIAAVRIDDTCGFKDFAKIAVNDSPAFRIGIIDPDLRLGQFVLEYIILDTYK